MYRQDSVDCPFEITEENIQVPEHFKSNQDIRLNFVKNVISRDNARATLTFNLCASEILEFYAFFVITAENTKKYCRFKLNLNSQENKYIVCDVIGNVFINSNGAGKITATFPVSIMEHY